MSVPNPPVIQDDDGPEEGEIEDDDDDIIFLDGSSPHRSSTTSTSLDVYPLPTRKDSYERDIRHFELRRARTARRRTSGTNKSTHTIGSSTRVKTKISRTGLTEGKENRHVRHTSPARVHRRRKESSENALVDFKDVSPLRRDSSCSSIDSDERTTGRAPYHRSSRKTSSKTARFKRKSSSSPESTYIPSKRRSHHSEKCPLMKVLHSVAKETRLIAMENSESHSESSSLRQRLLNMGAMPSVHEETHSKDQNQSNISFAQDENIALDNSSKTEESSKQVQNGSTQTEEPPAYLLDKPAPEIVVLTDNEEVDSNQQNMSKEKNHTSSNTSLPKRAPTSDTSLYVPSNTEKTDIVVNSENDEDDDISHLRLLALQSKKHEPSPPEDADVLQLRLAALKTAFIKKLKTRKKISIKINSRISKEDPLSPLDEIPIPFSVPSPDEVMTPVDMELAETDDEDAFVDPIIHYSPSDPVPDCYSPSDPIPNHFSSPNHYPDCYSPSDPIPDHISSPIPYPECYSPSDPTGSPILESSLQDLLPPPPPPDLDLLYADQPLDTGFQNNLYHTGSFMNTGYEQSQDLLALPPLPPYFQQLLSEPPEQSVGTFSTEQEKLTSIVNVDCCTLGDASNEISSNLIEVPVVIDIEPECDELVPAATQSSYSEEDRVENKAGAGDDPVPLTVCPADSNPSCSPNVSETTRKDEEEIAKPNQVSLEEEEKMLRQRLLLNMARKKENLPKQKKLEPETVNKRSQALPKSAPIEKVQAKVKLPKNIFTKTSTPKPMAVATSESPTLRRSTTPVVAVTTAATVKRVIVNLGEDSDSCEDYSEAEALGQKCIENKEKWLLHLKELEVNPPKMISPGNKSKPVIRGKATSSATIKSKLPIQDENGRKPFAENLADLESSVERFLKGVRSSQEAISKSKSSLGLKSTPSNGTPVAVKHLPASQQEEYRRLKQQIATLEKQRQISIEQKRVPPSVSIGTQMNTSTHQKNTNLINKGPSKVVLSSHSRSQTSEASVLKRDSKAVNTSASSIILKQPVSTSTLKNVKAAAPRTSPKVMNVNARQTSSDTGKVAVSQSSSQTDFSKLPRDTQLLKGKTALANVSNLSATSLPNLTKTVLEPQKTIKTSTAVAPNPSSLSSLEESLVLERSHVLSELSALSKLLSQVDQSLEAQSQTAGEVSSLIDKLCLAAGRWKAQNVTVTSLVQKVAERQKELSSRHRRCVALSKSCTELGSKQIGKSYRSPGAKADAMHLQLKQVHEKTQDLARRKTAERSRRNVLEKRAEDCLIKLFSDSSAENLKSANQAPAPSLKASAQEKLRVAPGAIQVKSPATGSTSDALSSVHGKTSLQVDPALISKAISMRLASNKIRSAKATLNLANKRLNTRKSRKFKSSNKQAPSLDIRQYSSDMDISTDGEEAEKKSKNCSGNTDVVDMLVSPGSSLSAPETDPVNTPSEGSSENVCQNAASSRNIVGFESYYDDIPIDINATNTRDPPSVGKEASHKKHATGNDKTLASSRNFLKDYVSPLNGLNVFSSVSSKEKFKEDVLDPYAILCPYDLNGKCQDTDCQYIHQHQ
ncbi:uncharacterized protein LOC117644886 [Thrips palmi]|uniref:Uncharacterized protein LOC117644886 n=1 Tax=Thrips palmi TaxID=161013 RepID=A0A6P8YTN5_THRPL|nr:uncharacterized protein LOC117644886 [Thrips palmi]XP_034240471.1 uncharacterized protein LOC117644886 [Thrips palmi]